MKNRMTLRSYWPWMKQIPLSSSQANPEVPSLIGACLVPIRLAALEQASKDIREAVNATICGVWNGPMIDLLLRTILDRPRHICLFQNYENYMRLAEYDTIVEAGFSLLSWFISSGRGG